MQSNHIENSPINQRPVLSKRTRWYIWIILFIILINCDVTPGLMAAGGPTIKINLGMMDLEYGCFAAMFAIGRMIGSLLFVSLINAVNRKYLIIAAVIFKACTVYICCYTNDGYFLLAVRLLYGIGYIFPVIYGPIWVDQLCGQRWRYFMMSGFSICGSIGRSTGFLMDYFMGSKNWKLGFWINASFLLGLGILLCFFPNFYFSSKLMAVSSKDGGDQLSPSQARVVSVFNVRESEVNERDINVCNKYWVIFSNPVYIFCLLARVVINSITSVLVFWIPSYLTDVIGYQNREIKLVCYLTMIVTFPFIGSFLGSYASAAVGGYGNKHSLVIVLIFNLISCLVFAPSFYVDQWYGFLVCCSLFQICGSAVLPTLNGIILSSIPGHLKAKGFAIANVVSLLFGSAPSPIIYGFINDKYKIIDKRFCMKAFVIYSFIGLIWIIIAVIFRYRAEEKDQKKELFTQVQKQSPTKDVKMQTMTGEGADFPTDAYIQRDNDIDGKEIN